MRKLSAVCVYCGSRSGADAQYLKEATKLGVAVAHAKVKLIYGGASIGMMGEIARATLAHGGHVTGIIPKFLTMLETPLEGVSERVLTEDMHQRKQIMFNRADAFIVMPGGIGTLDEVMEMLTWRQLHRHRKPIVFVNIKGYWDSLLALLDHIVDSGFAHENVRSYYSVVNRAEDALPAIQKALATLEPAQ
jgi:uncharacterized protein (TIGR00730 family)